MTKAKKEVAVVEATPLVAETVLVGFDFIKEPFTFADNRVQYKKGDIIRFIGTIAVVNQTLRQGFSIADTDKFDDIIVGLVGAGYEMSKVAKFDDFFNEDRIFKEILDGKNKLPFLSKIGVAITPEEVNALTAVMSIKEKLKVFSAAFGPSYSRMAIPENPKFLYVTGDNVSNGSYSVTKKQAENLWKRCYKVWSGEETDNSKGQLRVGSWDRHRIKVKDDKVDVGCQSIPRYQVEEYASNQGWI